MQIKDAAKKCNKVGFRLDTWSWTLFKDSYGGFNYDFHLKILDPATEHVERGTDHLHEEDVLQGPSNVFNIIETKVFKEVFGEALKARN